MFKIGPVMAILDFPHNHHPISIIAIYYHAKSGGCSFKIDRVMAIVDFHHHYHHCYHHHHHGYHRHHNPIGII